MSRLPLRVRLTLVFATVMACVLAAMAAFVYVRVGDALASSIDQGLAAQTAESARDAVLGRRLADSDRAEGARLAEVVLPSGAVVRSTPAGLAPVLRPEVAARVSRGSRVVATTAVSGHAGDWRLLAVPVRVASGRAALVLLAPLGARAETLHRLFVEFLVAGPIALALASLAGYALAAAALRPVESMRRRAAAITASTAGQRLPQPKSRDEIGRLAETLNEMLGRLEAALEHERRFVADASHELRTPLALLRTGLEVALRRPRSNAELEEALRSAVEETERLSRLTEELLLIARSEQGPLPLRPEEVEAGVLLERVAERYARRAAAAGRVVAVAETNGIRLAVDPTRIEAAVGNLVDNALVHGSGKVELSAQVHGGFVHLTVHDEGAGFPPGFAPHAFDRFSRADEARGRPGSGLGLSIVDLVARAHGGAAHVANRSGSGTVVWIELPNAQEIHSRMRAGS